MDPCSQPCIRGLDPVNTMIGHRNSIYFPHCPGTGKGPMPCRQGVHCPGIVRPRILNAL